MIRVLDARRVGEGRDSFVDYLVQVEVRVPAGACAFQIRARISLMPMLRSPLMPVLHSLAPPPCPWSTRS